MKSDKVFIIAVIITIIFSIIMIFNVNPDVVLKGYSLIISNKSVAIVHFSNNSVNAEIADTPAERTQGLMFRKSLDEDNGMLFIFESNGYYSFWMKNTYIPLDIIWINNNHVIHIEHAIPCNDSCISYYPNSSARYVLEVNGGFTDRYNIRIGDTITIDYR
ncbi:MAG: DUF192 domain-containing protein [Candidatus Aenigmatarchaeota archaeon]